MDSLVTWFVRFVHVTAAAFWVGGYAILALAVVPLCKDGMQEPTRRVALAAVRVLTYSGVLTILSGALLVARTRGYGQIVAGEWGGIVISAFVLALTLMAIGDAALRPALQRLTPETGGDQPTAQRWAIAGLVLTIAAVALMTRAIYARS